MKKFYVYIHTCPNGKKYVGVTGREPEIRWAEGNGYQYNKHFYSAILKYGWSNITHEVFEVESEEEMYRKEIELISFYHSNDPEYGYNNSSGGEYSHLGCKSSEETRRKISEALKGKPRKPLSEETRKKISEAGKGKHHSEETRKKISKSHKGKLHSEETKKHLSEVHKGKPGKPCSEETRRKISEARKKEWLDPEIRKKRSKAIKESVSDPEFRRKKSEANKGKTFSEETRKKMSEASRKKWSDPEYRKHMSEAHKSKSLPKVKISLPDGTIVEITKQHLVKDYVNKGRKFEYVSE